MKRGETYSSGWLKAADMLDQGHADGLNLTIKGVRSHKMDDGKTQRVLSFHEDDRELGLNQTNWDAVAEVSGKNDDDEWIGVRICAYPQKLDRPYQGYTHGMRIKAPTDRTAKASTNGDLWTLEQATAAAGKVGIDKPRLIEALKNQGLKTWKPEVCTPIVREMIEATEADIAFGNIPSANEEVEL